MMKRLLQTTTLLSALLLAQGLPAQNATLTVTKDSKQEVSQEKENKQNRQENPFYTSRFSREELTHQLHYRDSREQSSDYLSQNNIKHYNELREFVRDRPLLNTFYEMSTDKEPFQLYNDRINLIFSSSGKKHSPVNGFIRRLIRIFKKKS